MNFSVGHRVRRDVQFPEISLKKKNNLNVPESIKAASVNKTKIANAAPMIITFIVKGSFIGDLLLDIAS